MGCKAQSAGQLAEQLFELSLRQYQAAGQLAWIKTYAPTVTGYDPLGNLRTFHVESGPPDYCITLAPTGRQMWVEVKTWQGKNKHTYKSRLHQYDKMIEGLSVGALGFYLVLWRWEAVEDWRLYPIKELRYKNRSLEFIKREGRTVRDKHGWPDWFDATEIL